MQLLLRYSVMQMHFISDTDPNTKGFKSNAMT